MRDYIELGPTPPCEDCTPAGTNPDRELKECRAYKHQLQRMFPKADFGIKSFQHDFGTYREVVVYYDHLTIEVALDVEHNLPAHWDEIAQSEL